MSRTPLLPGQPMPINTDEIPFPFGPEFQLKLLKVLMLDDSGDIVLEKISSGDFDAQEMRWIYGEMKVYWQAYKMMPTWMVLRQRSQTAADPKIKATIIAMLEHLETLPVKEEQWIRQALLEWIKQNIAHKVFKETTALWNTGKRNQAIAHIQKEFDKINDAVWEEPKRSWFFEELSQREYRRTIVNPQQSAIPTGVHELDNILDGGLSKKELGIWIGYAKGGKSTELLNLGAQATRMAHKKTLHIILEGDMGATATRYDTWFSEEFHNSVKHGNLSTKAYTELFNEYKHLRGLIVLREFLDKFDYTVLDIEQELKQLRKQFGWIPDLIIVDYLDLLKGRNPPYHTKWEQDMDAARDLKLLANRGYAIWTASQAQRPEMKTWATTPHLLSSMQIAGGLEKVRVADFIGSLNQTQEERQQGTARLYAEMYRDNEAGKTIHVKTDASRIQIGSKPYVPPSPSVGSGPVPPPEIPKLDGYGKGKDGKGPKKK